MKKRPYSVRVFGEKRSVSFTIDNNAFVEAQRLADEKGKTVRVLKGNEVVREYQPRSESERLDIEIRRTEVHLARLRSFRFALSTDSGTPPEGVH